MDRKVSTADDNATVTSLSARRAWIEKVTGPTAQLCRVVALRKESVDRKAGGFPTLKAMRGSLSARRAWIENEEPLNAQWEYKGRSPQGERG